MHSSLTKQQTPPNYRSGTTREYARTIASRGGVPTGAIVIQGKSAPAAGYLACDGSSYLASEFPGLFAVIKYAFGGSGNQFSVPDLRSRSPIGYQSGSWNIASTGGEEQHALLIGETPSHAHFLSGTASDGGHSHGITYYAFSPSNGAFADDSSSINSFLSTTSTVTQNVTFGGTSGTAGSNASHNTMHPYIVMAFWIKT